MWFLISGSWLVMGHAAVEHDGRQGLHPQDEKRRPQESFHESPDRHAQGSVPSLNKVDRHDEAAEHHPERAETRPDRLAGNRALTFIEGSACEVTPAGFREGRYSEN